MAFSAKSILERIKRFFFGKDEEKELRDRLEQRIVRDIKSGRIRFNKEGKIVSTDEIKREFSKLERTVAEMQREKALKDTKSKDFPEKMMQERETIISELTEQLLKEQEIKLQKKLAEEKKKPVKLTPKPIPKPAIKPPVKKIAPRLPVYVPKPHKAAARKPTKQKKKTTRKPKRPRKRKITHRKKRKPKQIGIIKVEVAKDSARKIPITIQPMEKPMQPSPKKIPETFQPKPEKEKPSDVKISQDVVKEIKQAIEETRPSSDRRMEASLLEWKNEKKEYLDKISSLEQQINAAKIPSTQAMGSINSLFEKLNRETKTIDDEIKETEQKMAYMERKFLKRQVTEQEFRNRMIGLDNQLHTLKAKKKEIESHKNEAEKTKHRIESESPVSDKSDVSFAPEKVDVKSKTPSPPVKHIKQIISKEPSQERQREAKDSYSQIPAQQKPSSQPQVTHHPAKGAARKPQPPVQEIQYVSQIGPGSSEPSEPVTQKTPQKPPKEVEKPDVKTSSGKTKQVPETPGPVTLKRPELRQLLEQKAGGKLTQERLNSMETKINQLLEKYRLPEARVTAEMEKLDQNQMLASFSKLVNVLEMEAAAKRMMEEPKYYIKPAPVETVIPGEKKFKRDITSTMQDIQLKRIVTDFDKILAFVKDKGYAKEAVIAKQLNIDKKRIREVSTILEERGLVRIDFPLIGDMVITDINYKKVKKKKKKK